MSALLAQSVDNCASVVHAEVVVLHDVTFEFIHEFAVHVNDRSAAGAFEVEMPVAAVFPVDELIHGAFSAVGEEFLDFSVFHHPLKTSVDGRLADFFTGIHEVQVYFIRRHAGIGINSEIILNGILLPRSVILFAVPVVHCITPES